MIDSLLGQNRFTILTFDNAIEYPSHAEEHLVEASDRHRWRALGWLARINARGGTESRAR
jgi:Ca-activated chloride channel family protein